MITKKTATDIAMAYREVETSEALLADIEGSLRTRDTPDIRDAFGRQQHGLQLGVPSGSSGHRPFKFNVQWALAKPVIEAHIAQQKSIISALNAKARTELDADDAP